MKGEEIAPLRRAVPRGWKRSWRAREGCARSVKGSRCNKYAIQESCAASIRQLFGCAASQEQCLLSDEATTGLWKTRNREEGGTSLLCERPRLSRHLYIGEGRGDFFSHLSARQARSRQLRWWIFHRAIQFLLTPVVDSNVITWRCCITRIFRPKFRKFMIIAKRFVNSNFINWAIKESEDFEKGRSSREKKFYNSSWILNCFLNCFFVNRSFKYFVSQGAEQFRGFKKF